MRTVMFMRRSLLVVFLVSCFTTISWGQVSFSTGKLSGAIPGKPTSLQFGPDGKLYVATQDGTIYRYTVQKSGTLYQAASTEIITLIKQIKNYNDDGTLNTAVTSRQITGILVTGTATAPKIYVTSSDPRIGGSGTEGSSPNGDGDLNLDTNSGTLSLLTYNGSTWSKTDLVRGMPRSEENHSQNGMALDEATNSLYIASGGMTNAGSPSVNFAMITEYALAGCILKIDLNAINALPIMGTGNDKYVYNLPTLDDPTRTNSGSGDVNDPFGGNDGRNMAKIVPGGPVQVFSPGFRNMYDLVLTKTAGKAGRLYGVDNGANQGWGGYPDKEGTAQVTNNYVIGEPGSLGPGVNDPQVNNLDQLHLVYKPGMNPIYGGHPVPIRANPAGAGLFWKNSTGNNFSLTPTSDWPPVPVSMANPVEGDYRQAGVNDGALTTFNASTNGITEYTSTAYFNGDLTGDLLMASFDGRIYRVKLSSDGSSVISKTILASGFASIPLDITAQGDNSIFPGTIWVADYNGNSIYYFEPVGVPSNTGWATITPTTLPEKRHENAFVESGGKFYLLGGRGIKAVNIYNPSTNSWTTGAAIPGSKELHHFQAVSVNGNIYIINAFTGVYPTETPVPDIYVYNVANNKWTIETNAIPLARRRGSCATAVYNGKIYMAGGIVNGHNSGTVNWTDVYDPVSKSWTILANAPKYRDHVQGAVINGKLYLAGGRRTSASTNVIFTDTEPAVDVYDIATNTWTTLPSTANIPLQRAGAGAVNLNNKLVIIGGESIQTTAHNEVHSFDPVTNTWTILPKLVTGRHGTQSTVLNTNIFVAAGNSMQGGSTTTELNSLEKYTAAVSTCTGNTTSTTLDDDGDGYSNKDETDNQTDPCNAASKPKDNDGDKLSDLNDQDDDNDGIPDVSDVFHIDAQNGKNKIASFLYPFLNGDPGTGLFGMGFTGLMTNGTDPGKLYDENANGFIMGGAVGLASLPANSGSPLTNTQKQAFQFGFMMNTSTPVTVESGLIYPFFNGTAANTLKDELQGIYIGTGDQDNYVLVAITPNFGNPALAVIREDAGVVSQQLYPVADILNGNLTLYLTIDPVSGNVQPKYKRLSDTAPVNLGSAFAVSGKLLNVIKGSVALATGILASSRTGTGFSATWDYMNISSQGMSSPTIRINAGGPAVTAGGVNWSADGFYSSLDPLNPSYTFTSSTPVTGTTASTIYQSERYGKAFLYTIPIPNGSYNVKLHFAEIYWDMPGKRVFNVNVENGQGLLNNFDIYALAGKNIALTREFVINPTDGNITISLESVLDLAKLSAIEITQAIPDTIKRLNTARINSGGPQLTFNGNTWMADAYAKDASALNPSKTFTSTEFIGNTDMMSLYQSERYGQSFSYAIPMVNGTYSVKLHFAEVYWTQPGQRVMNINVEGGQGVLNNFDILAGAAANTAVIKEFIVNLADSEMNIQFNAVVDMAKVSAIEIQPYNAPPPPPSNSTIYRINGGGPELNVNNVIWSADKLYSTDLSYAFNSTSSIGNTTNQALYQTERYGKTFSYAIPVPVGSYQVVLHFAELYWNITGARIFNVSVENQGSLTNFDIYAVAGKNNAVSRSFTVNVADGLLNIVFSAVIDNAKISGIEVIEVPNTVKAPSLLQTLEKSSEALTVHVAPNPFSNSIQLTFKGGDGTPVDLQIYSAHGQLVEQRKQVDPFQTIELGHLYQKGMYILEVKQNGVRVVSKIMKN